MKNSRKPAPQATEANTAIWLFVIQTGCFAARTAIGRADSFTTALACLGVTLALAGLYEGVRWLRRGARRHAFNSGVMSAVALLFWGVELITAYHKAAG